MASLRHWMFGCGAAAALTMGVPATIVGAVPAASAAAAPDGPGALSHFDLARKDCVGTARNTASKVWYTVANGVLSDVYYPTVDNTNVETLQYIVTDGVDLHRPADTRHDVHGQGPGRGRDGLRGDEHGQERPLQHRHRLLHRSRPEHPAHERAARADGSRSRRPTALRPVRPDRERQRRGRRGQRRQATRRSPTPPTGHPIAVASDTVTATNAANRDYAQPVFAALDGPFSQVTNGFAGAASDGLTQLDTDALAHHDLRLGRGRQRGPGRPAGPRPGGGKAVLALGFGATQAARRRDRRGARCAAKRRSRSRRATRPAGRPTTPALKAPPKKLPASSNRASRRARTGVLPERQRREGVRGQDLPGRDRRRPGLAVGPGGVGRRSRTTPTSARTARCSPATSTRRGPAHGWRRHWPPPGTRCCSCSTASSSPTARCRATAW